MNQDQERQLCETYYSHAIAGATSDEEELAVALALLEGAERGGVVNDAGTGLIYVSEPDIPVDADFLLDEERDLGRQIRRAWPALAALALAILVIVIRYGDWGGAPESVETPTPTTAVAVHLPTMTLTPVPTTAATATLTQAATVSPTSLPTETPTPVRPNEVEVKPEPVELEPGAVIPVSLEVAGRYFPVAPTTLRGEAWAYLPDPGTASWLAGSSVNVVLGLPYTPGTHELLASTLALSDTLTVRTSVGGANRYRVAERTSVGVYQIEALGQHAAGLTLILLGGNEESPDSRLMVRAIPIDTQSEE